MGDRDQTIRYYRLALELDPNIDLARRNPQALDQGSSRQPSLRRLIKSAPVRTIRKREQSLPLIGRYG